MDRSLLQVRERQRGRVGAPRRFHRSLPALVCFILALPGFVRAQGFPQYLVNPAFPDSLGDENRFDPAVAALTPGGFLLLWVDNGTGTTDILARRFGADLRGTGTPVRVNSDSTFTAHTAPSLAGPAAGNVVGAWIDGRFGSPTIHAQRFSAEGGAIRGENIRLSNQATVLSDRPPAMAMNSSGTVLP